MEKFYSVAAQLAGGETRVLPVRGQSAGEAFQLAKTNPGVRRVGRVTEITPGAYEALQRGETPARPAEASANHTSPERPATPSPAQLNAPLTGPRVVLHARPVGGEQPFRHLQAPPERLGPPPKPQPVAAPPKPQVAVAASSAQPAPLRQPTPTDPPRPALAQSHTPRPSEAALSTGSSGAPRGYRIVKSRRQGGDPYLLQRGQWQDRAGKRTFTIDWEKGFPTRPDAERHQEWLTHREQELADLRRQAG